MKKAFTILIFAFTLIYTGVIFSQTPTYNLRAMNFAYYGCPAKYLEFDIYIEHTNPPVYYEHAAAQFFFNFNSAIANGGTLTLQKVGTELPLLYQNQTFQVLGTRLGVSTNIDWECGTGPIFTNNGYPGTKLIRLRLTTSASSLAIVPLNLEWRSAAPAPFTKIAACVNGSALEIQTPNTHFIDMGQSNVCELFNPISPPHFNQLVQNPVNFSWYSASQAVSYKLLVAADSNFTNIVHVDSSITDTFSAVPLAVNTTYFWKVLAYDNNSYYLTTPTWTFKTGEINPGLIPTYNLSVKNFQLNSPQDNELTFEIYLHHTNPPVFFEYPTGQYIFNFNPLIANGGTLTYELLTSDLPVNIRPVNPHFFPPNQLRMAANTAPPAGQGYNVTGNSLPGTLIAKMKLKTSAPSFAIDSLNLRWRKLSDGNPFTRIYARINLLLTEITTDSTHTIDPLAVLPVELSSFTSIVNKNSVKLDWSTSTETDNSGFEIERSTDNLQWIKAAFVESNGNSNTLVNYSYTDRNLSSGKYFYRLKQIDYNGNYEYYELQNEVNVGVPENYSLSQNYPNPFNPSTKIDFELPAESKVSLRVYNISGKEVSTLVSELKPAGYHSLNFNASNLSSGIYFYRLEANGFSRTMKMMVVK